MSTTKISSEQRRYLRERIDALFTTARNTLNDRAILRRQEVTRQVIDDAGLDKGKEAAQRLVEAYAAVAEKFRKEREKIEESIHELNNQFMTIRGTGAIDLNNHYYERGGATIISAFSTNPGTPLGRKIDEAMEMTPEGGQIKQLNELKISIEDRLMLDYEGKTGQEILTEVQESIQKIVSAPLSLPPAPSGKTPGQKGAKK